MLYACDNIQTTQRIVKRLNVGTPSYMRAPGEAPGTFSRWNAGWTNSRAN